MLLGHRVLDWTLSTAGLLVMFLGVYDVIQNREENKCEMTYMYHMPEYEPVLKSINDKYGLYLYSEYSKREMDSKVPVLFIPGNAGSYKQVRSLASVALRMAIDKKFSFEFDFYSIDFHEEFSALYGGFLDQQVDFTYECLDFITKKYPQNTGIIIIGHSVGGLIGRTVLSHTKYPFLNSRVKLLLTLATPHTPIFIPDQELDIFYRRLPYIDPKVSYINIGGGVRDIQVRSGLASFEFADVDVILSSSPGIWVSADHRCIVWCKQLIIAINRALFEVVHQGIIKDRESITSSFKYHLEKRNYFFKSSKLAEEQTTRSLSYHVSSCKTSWISDERFHFSTLYKINQTFIFLMNTVEGSKKTLHVESSHLRGNWIFGCRGKDNENICLAPVNLFELVNVLPGKRRSAVHLPLNTNQFSHYAIVIKKGSESPKINVDVYESSHRVLSVVSTNIKDYLGLPFILKAKTDPAASFYNITFPDLTSPWKAYEIVVYPQGHCETNKDILGSMHFVNSESKEVTHSQIFNNRSSLYARLLSMPNTNTLNYMLLSLNKDCSYTIEARLSWLQSFGQIVRYYTPHIVSLFISVILFTMGAQYRDYAEQTCFPSSWSVTILSPINISVYLKIIASAAPFILDFYSISLKSHALDNSNLYVFLLYIAMGCALLFSGIAWLLIIVGGNALSKSLSAWTVIPEFVADYALEYVWRLSPLIFPVLGAIAFTTCGSFVITLGLLLHVLKLFKMYEIYLQDISKEENHPRLLSEFTEKTTSMNFKFSVTILWFLSSLLNFPVLLSWIRNDFHSLSYDPSFYSALIFSCSSMYSLSNSSLKPTLKYYNFISYCLNISGFLSLLFFTLKVYRINYILNLAISLVVLHQLFGPTIC